MEEGEAVHGEEKVLKRKSLLVRKTIAKKTEMDKRKKEKKSMYQ